jgi:hypothetical protein
VQADISAEDKKIHVSLLSFLPNVLSSASGWKWIPSLIVVSISEEIREAA